MSQSKLLLFLSADIVGSTAYKNSNRESKDSLQPWLQFFRDFYQEFPARVTYWSNHTNSSMSSPCVWKAAGDELLFSAQLKCHTEALEQVHAFKLAINEYAQGIKKKGLPLGVKGCAWIAGFPVINAQVDLYSDGAPRADYIGPLIDAGFRLAKYATERKFVISVETALLMTSAWAEPTAPKPMFFFDGREVLKGVLSERPYPIIWVDMYDGIDPIEDELMGTKRSTASPERLNRYCRDFISGAMPDLVIPYIEGCKSSEFNQIPSEHLDILRQLTDPQGLIENSEDQEPEGGVQTLAFEETRTTPISTNRGE